MRMIQRFVYGLLRFGFRLLYNEFAWTYDVVSWLVSLGAWREWQQAGLPYVQGQRVLEIGHGPGHMLLALRADGREVVGVDLSPYMGRQARKRLRRAQEPPCLVRSKVQSLPFGTAVFDTVFATFPTDYIIDPETLTAVYRVLNPDGRFVIVPEGHLTGTGFIYRLIDWLFRVTGQRSGAFAVDGDNYWPSPEIWAPFRQRFTQAGFQVEFNHIQLARSGVTVIVARKANATC
jgi:ubiquinone/menaquinone biosynthesis C-methylase UbiE